MMLDIGIGVICGMLLGWLIWAPKPVGFWDGLRWRDTKPKPKSERIAGFDAEDVEQWIERT